MACRFCHQVCTAGLVAGATRVSSAVSSCVWMSLVSRWNSASVTIWAGSGNCTFGVVVAAASGCLAGE